MAFGDLQSHGGLLLLNKFLADKSYIEGYHPTQGDLLIFEAVKKAPSADLENVLRWYKHIASFTDEEKQKFDDQHQFKSLSVNPDDVDIDLFGDEDEEESEQTKQRLAAYRERKAKQPVVIAKSSIVLDVKPWDDETNMEELEKNVRSIELDGLLWGASHLVPVAYGIRILQITCVVEDDKVGTDTLEERITEFKDHIQSMDISSFRRI